MKGNDEEKLLKTYWMRPVLHRSFIGSKWRLLKKKLSTSKSNLVLSFFFFFLLALMLLAAWIHLAKYAGYSSQKAPQNFNRTPSISILEFPLDCSVWNQTNKCPKNYPTSYLPQNSNPTSNPKCPEFFRWIHEDLKPWRETGITNEMVEKARKTAHFRLVILDGKIYVEKFRQSIQTRALFTMWGIVQLMRWYPGKLPDLELMFDCDDRPVIQAQHFRRPNSAPPPLFRYCSDWRSLDIVFPDWSFWGWAETNLKPWKIVLNEIKEGNKRTKWEDRVPYAYWKGNPNVCPWRGDLMQCNVTDKDDWNTRLYVQDWDKEAKIGFKQSNVADQCTHRYKIYIEGWAWSVSEKYILACDSPTLLMTLRWHDFFIRGMIPQQHYWPVRDNDKCRSLKFAVEWGNNRTKKILCKPLMWRDLNLSHQLLPDLPTCSMVEIALHQLFAQNLIQVAYTKSGAKSIGETGSSFIHEDLKMENVYDYMFHLLNEYAKLFKYKPTIPPNAVELCAESMACPADGIWKEFMELSLEKSPSSSDPCTMPPPYGPQELKSFVDAKVKSTKEVETWENEYWEKQIKKQ